MARAKQHVRRGTDQDDLFAEVLAYAAAAGILPAEFARRVRKTLRSLPDPERALKNYHRFLRAGFTTSLIRDFHAHPILEEVFLRLAAQSQYLSDILVRTPELLHWLTATGVLGSSRPREEYLREAAQAVAPFERTEKRLNALKRFQRRELLRLGAREILGEAPGHAIAAELSALADAVVGIALGIARDEVRNRFGTVPTDLAVIALGKLGGEELNFSSDIDLMFVYEKDEDFPSPIGGVVTAHQLHSRVVESTVRLLSEHTAEGYCYRVDLRLRPDGQAGPVTMSRAATMTYYESRGELWERQMLIKARPMAGEPEVGAAFLNDIRPFVYPRTHIRSPLEEISAIKQRIEQKVAGRENLKLGAGGIRDIEFIVQGLQLVHGGTSERIREGGTLIALERLRSSAILSVKEQRELQDAYVFLRSVEHRLQLLEGRQTHSLPVSERELAMLARRLGFVSSASFRAKLARHRTAVRRAFERTFSPQRTGRATRKRGTRVDPSQQFSRDLGLPWSPAVVERIALLRTLLSPLREDPVLRSFAKAFHRARATPQALEHFALLAGTGPIRRTLSAALSSPRFVELLVHICASGGALPRMLANEPLLFESLAGRPEEFLGGTDAWSFLRHSDPSRFKTYNEARILLRHVAGISPLGGMFAELSHLAEGMVRQAFEESLQAAEVPAGDRLILVALGKLGSGELTIGSDLDLLFLFKGSSEAERARSETVVRRFLGTLTSGNPPVYHVDLRLRPEGKNAPVVSTMEYFGDYFAGRAQLWERQSLLRAKVIAGSEGLQREAAALLEAITYDRPLAGGWVEELRAMRERIEINRGKGKPGLVDLKTASGGLLDIEFTVQALQLGWGKRVSSLRTPSVVLALEVLKSVPALPKHAAARLTENYRWLRKLELSIKMNSATPEFVWPLSEGAADPVVSAMGERTQAALGRRLNAVRRQNREILTSVLTSLGRPDAKHPSDH